MNAGLLERFVEEARELLQVAAAGLLALERDPGDNARVNEVFRAVHTLKGSSGLFDAPALTRLVHAGEDVLQAVRTGGLALDPALVDLLLDALDQVGGFVDQLDRDGRLAGEADRIATAGAAALRARLGDETPDGAAVPADAALATAPADWLTALPREAIAEASARAAAGGTIVAIRYTPDEGCFYTGTDPLGAIRAVPDLIGVGVSHREPLGENWDAAGAFDPYRCNLVFTALSAASREAIEQALTYELDQIVLARFGDAPAPAPDAAAPDAVVPVAPALGPAALHIVATQRRVLGGSVDAVRLRSLTAVIGNLLRSLGDERRATWEALTATAAETGDTAPLADFLAALAGEAPAAVAAPPPIAPPAADAKSAPATSQAAPQANHILKVDQGKIDLLMNLIGELAVLKNALPFLARRAEDVHGSREMAREIKEQFATLDRLTQEMQGAIMQVRMLPVAEVFDRFPRLVRDIARKLDKQVTLVTDGADTAADKTIIEALGDPLLHIVRNSLDHGIEGPAVRIAAGKPAAATLRLAAWQASDSVVIEIADDGRGIDPVRIRAAAVGKGLLDQEAADALSDQEAINLIYRPGFSTAAAVSDLSGRGVGMDVVLSTVQKLGGRVTVTSALGEGTVTRLSLPLSMAVTRVMVVDIGASLYGIPIDHVVQTTRLPAQAIQRVKQREVFVVRDEIVPLVRMAALLGGTPAPVDPDRGEAVLVCRVEGRTIGLVIDDFREGMDVILKPMAGILADVGGYCGTTLLGDGRVLLVLDLKELV